jgi:hypothetical protein
LGCGSFLILCWRGRLAAAETGGWSVCHLTTFAIEGLSRLSRSRLWAVGSPGSWSSLWLKAKFAVRVGVVLAKGSFQIGTEQYSWVNPGSICIDVRAAGGFHYLLWGEPGLRWVWGVGFFLLVKSVAVEGPSPVGTLAGWNLGGWSPGSCGSSRLKPELCRRRGHGGGAKVTWMEVSESSSQNGTRQYFRVNARSICIDMLLTEASATCCGVNLAFARLGVWFSVRGSRFDLFAARVRFFAG